MINRLKKDPKLVISTFVVFSFFFLIFFIHYLYLLNEDIKISLEKKSFVKPIEFYAAPEPFSLLQNITKAEIIQRYNESYPLLRHEDVSPEVCTALINTESPLDSCLRLNLPNNGSDNYYIIGLQQNSIQSIYSLSTNKNVFQVNLLPLLVSQYYNDKPILKREIELGDTPPICLNSILAIEDNSFLEHKGFNIKSIARAFLKNIQEGRRAQGGSTITQQLVKNYFLSHEKTYTRKIKELLMAILLETRFHKDQILQAYINEIYMGQNGVFEVRGFGTASNFYFNKPIENLNLPECALLAAIINSPGRYNPQRKPENATQRRELVLKKLLESNIINQQDYLQALTYPLPKHDLNSLDDPSPYFMDAVKMQLTELGIENQNGLKVYTTMSIAAQKAAKQAVQYGMERIHKNYSKRLPKDSKNLQGILISADPLTGKVVALVGGTDYRLYPFNRAIKAHRQVGSTMKAFVYLSALESFTPEGNPYSPLTILDDSPHTFKYEGQVWKPKNYKSKYYGNIPLFFALKNSLNLATAKLAVNTGLEGIIQVANKFGITSEMKPVPALSLGAFELYPVELLQAYTTIARLGSKLPLTLIESVSDHEGKILYEHIGEEEQVYSKEKTAVLVGMMKQTIENGTGHLARILGYKQIAAGKTGTTSDSNDAWFAGFSPNLVAVSWVGFDDNRKHNLTGASGALPIWTKYMKTYGQRFPNIDFNFPETTYRLPLAQHQLEQLGIDAESADKMGDIELIFEANHTIPQ